MVVFFHTKKKHTWNSTAELQSPSFLSPVGIQAIHIETFKLAHGL